MNNCPEIVETVTGGGGFPWILLVVAAIVAGVFVYKNGIVGTEASLKALATKLHERAAKIEAKWKAKQAKAAAVPAASVAAPVAAAPSAGKAAKLAELNGMLISGKITLEQHALMAKLLG